MKRIRTYFAFPLIVLTLLIFALSSQMFGLPPLGKLLDPFIGAVQNGGDRHINETSLSISEKELSDSVQVFFDERKVPHIYAKNEQDLYFTQGYVTASLRLWQMDFLSYAAAGRLTEVLGKEEFVSYDRNQRRLGIWDAAKKSLAMMEKDPETNRVLTAYTNGVNAYIRNMTYKDLPFEYKLLDYKPEPWTKLKSVLILKNMANLLSGYGEDVSMTKMYLALGEEKFGKLYPDFHTHISPVMNTPAPSKDIAMTPFKKPDYLDYSFLSTTPVVPSTGNYNPRLGSNSWAVSGKKTKSGFPILASDPHLNLSLPGVWVEMQLSAPGVNVYGVSIPGTPAVIIGFNDKIAWGITNGADDVKDWYKLKITEDYKKYELDGNWHDLKFRVEEIKRRGGLKSIYDTIYSTVHGPIINDRSFRSNPELMNCALKWELHNASNEFLAFLKINKATNYDEFKDGLKHYSCPVQNFTFISKDNTIAVNHQGNIAVKWPGQGKFILDGTRSDHIATRYIPADSLPQSHNPETNYVLSANQHPTNAGYPYYYNGYYSETRANRLRDVLDRENGLDIARMEALQLDNTNYFAEQVLPLLLQNTDRTRLNAAQQQVLDRMASWKGTYNSADESAKVFDMWWKNVTDYTWDELRSYPFFLRAPESYVLMDFIRNEPANEYFDRRVTTKKENAADIITEAFAAATGEYDKAKQAGKVKWSDFNRVNIMHLTNLPAFSRMNLPSAGHPDALNATSASWGPSWRMIVELGDRPKAFGIYPGGQSGNVGSANYDNFVSDWNQGKYYPLHYFLSPAEASKAAGSTWILGSKK
ncbi:MAG TPA: penicillin acylase family protein [Flavisolibacter sp.]|jgi:penicillin amidase